MLMYVIQGFVGPVLIMFLAGVLLGNRQVGGTIAVIVVFMLFGLPYFMPFILRLFGEERGDRIAITLLALTPSLGQLLAEEYLEMRERKAKKLKK